MVITQVSALVRKHLPKEITGEDRIETFCLPSGEVLGLCTRHPVPWLLELLQSGDIHNDDKALLGKDFVISNLNATLI